VREGGRQEGYRRWVERERDALMFSLSFPCLHYTLLHCLTLRIRIARVSTGRRGGIFPTAQGAETGRPSQGKGNQPLHERGKTMPETLVHAGKINGGPRSLFENSKIH
jgi:hypothetical protein